jgi:Ca2+/H+ antiporter, TMEM165/GDT1 family
MAGRTFTPHAVSLQALTALMIVTLLGFALHRPLASIPENALKFVVGVLLSAFGTFWVGEGIGFYWSLADWSILYLIASYLVVALLTVRICSERKSLMSAEDPR